MRPGSCSLLLQRSTCSLLVHSADEHPPAGTRRGLVDSAMRPSARLCCCGREPARDAAPRATSMRGGVDVQLGRSIAWLSSSRQRQGVATMTTISRPVWLIVTHRQFWSMSHIVGSHLHALRLPIDIQQTKCRAAASSGFAAGVFICSFRAPHNKKSVRMRSRGVAVPQPLQKFAAFVTCARVGVKPNQDAATICRLVAPAPLRGCVVASVVSSTCLLSWALQS